MKFKDVKYKRSMVRRLLKRLEQGHKPEFPQDYRAVLNDYRPFMGRIFKAKIDKALAEL